MVEVGVERLLDRRLGRPSLVLGGARPHRHDHCSGTMADTAKARPV
jgi:hypothetical protein